MATEYVTHREFEAMRTEFRGEFALLRGEMKELKGELRGEMGELRGAVEALEARVDEQPTTRAMWVSFATIAMALVGLVLTSARLIG